MSISLTQTVHDHTDGLYLVHRVYNCIKTSIQKDGYGVTALKALAGTTAVIYGIGASYFCLKGAVVAFTGMSHTYEQNNTLVGVNDTFVAAENDTLVSVKGAGDAGGWLQLPFFSLLSIGTIAFQVLRESEYLQLKTICRQWIEDNKSDIENDPKRHKHLYDELNKIFDAFSPWCLFNKSVLSRRLIVLELYQQSGLADKGKKMAQHRNLEASLQKWEAKIEKKTSLRRYFYRVSTGFQEKRNGGYCEKIISAVMGIALPLLFETCAVLSLIGEMGLGKLLFYYLQDLDDEGHFGEWLINAVEAFSIAAFLHVWYIINEGDFVIVKKIYAKALNSLHQETASQKRLCELANIDLSEKALVCAFAKL